MAFLVLPSILFLGACSSYFAGSSYLKKNYPAPQPPKYKVGDEVTVKDETLKVIGYTGHSKETANNLQLKDHPIWIAETRLEAQTHARDNGAVATIAAKERAQSSYSRFDNGITADHPSANHKYTVVDIENVTSHTDDRTIASFKRMKDKHLGRNNL